MNTLCTKRLSALLLAASLCCAPLAQATVKTIELPPDGVQMKASNLPGYSKAAICAACHSAEYMQYQPATAARPYWEAMVKRMRLVFKAPINDADIPDIVDYLNQTYGSSLAK